MFETLVTGLLTSALGSYIEPKCFSSDKINVAVWSGYVVLTELEVKPEAVADLPAVKLVRGLVGSVELKIPWNRLQSDSVVATVDDVYLLLRTEADVDAVMRQMDEFTLKKKLLEELYAQEKHEEDAGTRTSSEDGFAARLFNKIIDNVELHVRRIHIRLEDYSTGDHPFSVGMTIESVHVQSTNSNWQPSYVDTSKSHEPRIYKIMELNHLSVYCDPEGELQRGCDINFETCSAETFSSAFNRAIPKRFDDNRFHHMQLYPSPQQHHFLLKPVDASARLVVNRDVFDASMPKFEIDVNVPEVAFRLEESQYCDLLYLVSALQAPDYYMKFQQYRESRPQIAVLDGPAEWWKYAIASVVKDVKSKKQQWTWGFIKDRREDRKRYVSLWQQKSRHLLELADVGYEYSDSDDDDDDDANEREGTMENVDHGGKNMSSLDLSNMSIFSPLDIDLGLDEIERRRSVEDVLFFRYLADLEVRKVLATRAFPVRRRLPTPPTHETQAFSDTESVETERTESSVPSEVQYRSWGAWMFGWTLKLVPSSSNEESGRAAHRMIPEVELRELFNILEGPCRRPKKRMYKHRDVRGQCDVSLGESQIEPAEVYRVTVTLQWGSVTLASDPEMSQTLLRDDLSYGQKYAPTDFLLGTFSQLQVATVARHETVVVDVSLQSIEAFDESAESSAFSRLLSRKQNVRSVGDGDDVNVTKLSSVVFLMSYEMNPASSSADASLFIHMEPLEIVLSPTAQCWRRLARFMDTPANIGLWEELEVASFNDIVNLKVRTEAKLGYVMENRIALAVDLRIQAPVIIVPQSDTDYSCARLVIDLGRIIFRTERLSQMDSESLRVQSRGDPLRDRLEEGTLALLNPSHYQPAKPNTSFVQQLYDEAEKGEGAIRWKEDFYDKFSLSVANIHVLLIPYGKTTQVQHNGAGNNGANVLPYLTDTYDEEYELIERLDINVIVRMSILPLDAMLTRFYIHADLPAFTVKLSLEKYHQLIALGDRFCLADAETLNKSRKDSDGVSTEDVFRNYAADVVESGDRCEASSRMSPRSVSALKKTVLDSGDNLGDSGDNSSVESDDTWFSISSDNMDTGASSASGGGGERKRSFCVSGSADAVGVDDTRNASMSSRFERGSRKRRRPFAVGETANLLDRRILESG
uniref:Chorein N-terminal domain-containing protein n=1 Tax=Hyaloperonospora arabidopsidis (strain Emoy2) TaxID=559515 RepID=M4BNJ8_HYAAE